LGTKQETRGGHAEVPKVRAVPVGGLMQEADSSEGEDNTPVSPSKAEGGIGGNVSDESDEDDEDARDELQKLHFTNTREFVVAPAPRDHGPVQCYIKRDRSDNKSYPKYSLHLNKSDTFLLGSRKRTGKSSSNYLVSLDLNDLERDSKENFIGKVRSNFLGTEFYVFDNGENPSKTKEATAWRQEYALCKYEYNILGTKGPRQMSVAIPKITSKGVAHCFRPDGASSVNSLAYSLKKNDTRHIMELRNKKPRWNEHLGAYCLNFNGRVTFASVKNFQLIDPAQEEYVVLQFGKVGKDLFTMDYQYPMSAFQAFAICLSSFDNKLACE